MRKNVYGKQLKRDKNERKALFKSLMSAMVIRERIETTEAKAKAIRPQIEKLVTKAVKGGNSSTRVLEQNLTKEAFEKMVSDIGPRFEKRQGGYTRIVRLGKRFGDDAKVVIMEWVEMASPALAVDNKAEKVKEEKNKPVKKAAAKKATKKAAAKKAKSTTRKKK
jgi:large subunit ribosomal protein L17